MKNRAALNSRSHMLWMDVCQRCYLYLITLSILLGNSFKCLQMSPGHTQMKIAIFFLFLSSLKCTVRPLRKLKGWNRICAMCKLIFLHLTTAKHIKCLAASETSLCSIGFCSRQSPISSRFRSHFTVCRT